MIFYTLIFIFFLSVISTLDTNCYETKFCDTGMPTSTIQKLIRIKDCADRHMYNKERKMTCIKALGDPKLYKAECGRLLKEC